jgi:hypothetical protein
VRLIAFTIIGLNIIYAVYWYLSPAEPVVDTSPAAATVMPGRKLVLADELSDPELLERYVAADVSGSCWVYGPLNEAQSTDLLARVVTVAPTAFKYVETLEVGVDYQVLVGPYDSDDDALVALPQIREFVDDSYVINTNQSIYISVGIFKLRENADAKLVEVKSKAQVLAIMREVPRSHDESWVAWPVESVEAPADLFANDFNELKLNGKLLKKPCEEVAQRG